jgi:hypothetical protein
LKYNFFEETHVWNKDVYANKIQKDPLTGKLPCIYVSGDFQESYNIMAIILPNPQKAHPIDYTICKENGTSEAFIGFLMYLIANAFFCTMNSL